MHPRISLNTFTTRDQSLADDLALCRELGIGHVGLVATKYADDPDAAAALCRDAGIKVAFLASFLGGVKPIELGDKAGEAVLNELRGAIDMAETAGAPLVYFTSGAPQRRMPSDPVIDALVGALPPAVAYAAERGVRLGVENSSVGTRAHGFIHTFADSVKLAERANIDITLELQNVWVETELAAQFKQHVAKIAVVQVSDFIVGENVAMNRCVPGDGDIPLEWLIGALLDAGYEGLFDIELVGPHIDREGAVPAVRRSAAWLDEVLTRLGA